VKKRVTITIFPFLSVLLCTMGLLSLLSILFLLLGRAGPSAAPAPAPPASEVRWTGAPEYVRPLLVECLPGEARLHLPGSGRTLSFARAKLRAEAGRLRELELRSLEQLGPTVERIALQRHLKNTIRGDNAWTGSLTRAFDQVEQDNWKGRRANEAAAYHPVLLIYPDGVDTYDLVSYLLETTSRLAVGLEPMLKGWVMPYAQEKL
jgi:hypothetical protein